MIDQCSITGVQGSREVILATLFALLASGCRPAPATSEPPAADPANVRAFPAELTLIAGMGAQLAAQVNDERGRPIGGAEIVFVSGSPQLVSVSARGFVTSVGPAGSGAVRVVSGTRQVLVPIIITPGMAQRVQKISGDQQMAMVGSELPDMLRVQVKDASDNPIPDCRVRFGVLPDMPTVIESACDSTGHAQARITLPEKSGQVLVAANVDGSSQAQATFTLQASPGDPVRMEAIDQASNGSAIISSVVRAAVRIVDKHANGVPGVEVQWKTVKGGGMPAPEASATDGSGIAATQWSLGAEIGPNVLQASVPDSKLRDLQITVMSVEQAAATEPETGDEVAERLVNDD